MDPGLWEMLEGDAGEEIEAIVRLQARDRMPPGLRLVAQFGEVATCRLPRSAILSARADEAVESLKAPRLLVGEPKIVELEPEGLSPESRAAANQRRPPSLAVTGRGVVVGIADWGCDFAHPDFCHNDGTTRLEALWDQRSSGDHAANRYGYGTIYTADEINRALRAEDPYAALGYHPAGGDPLGTGSHGTHVMGIAAGNGRAGGPEGVAPEADLVFVHLATGGPEGEANLGDSVRILEAIDFILGTADGRPCAINLSVGRTGGDKTGTSLVEQGLDAAVGAAPGRAIAQSAGNYYNQRMHTFAQLRPGEKRTFVWHTDRADVTPNELELWYPGRDVLSVELHSPDGAHSWRAAQGEQAPLTIGEQKVGMIYHRTFDPNNGDHHVDLFLYPEAPAGDWEVTVTGEDVVDGRTHGYVERDAACPSCQSRFDPLDAVPSSTTGTICNGYRTIAVGAYDPYSPDGELAPFSSGGPTRDGRQKPDLVAPGVSVLAPRSAPRDPGDEVPMYTVKSGTSMAAPHVTGTLALIFEAAGKPLPIADTRRLLLSGTRSVDATPGMAARIGSGYLDIERAVEATRAFTDEEQLWPGETAPVAVGQEGAHPVAGPEVAARQALYAEPQMQPDHTSFTDQSDGFSDPVETPHATTGPSDHERETKTEAVVNWEQESAWPGESEDRLLEEEDAESLDLFDLGDGLLEEEEDDGALEMQDLLEYEDDEAIDEEVYPYAQSMEMSLVDLADEAVSTGGNQGSPGALLEQVLSRAGIMETLSPLGPGSHGFTSPAVIFDAFAFGGIPALRDHFEQFLQVVAEPGSVMESDLRPGDLLIRRALGEGGLGHVAVVAAPEMWSYGQARSVGLIPESDRPAEYVQVVEGGARPHTLDDSFARLVLDEAGRVPIDQIILRPRMHSSGGVELATPTGPYLEELDERDWYTEEDFTEAKTPSRRWSRCSRFTANDARWAPDPVSPDYRHLGTAGLSQPFVFGASHLERLCQLGHFDVTGGQDEVLFGLRGCQIVEDNGGSFAASVRLTEDVPDHFNWHCVLGVWRRSSREIVVFRGSTVPNWGYMCRQVISGGREANLLPTGRYLYQVGRHRAVEGAFRLVGQVAVLRSNNNLIYETTDYWDRCAPADNIHPGSSPTFAHFSSRGCQTVPGRFKNGRHLGPWATFRERAGLDPNNNRDKWGQRFVYVLLTGREARLVSSLPDTSSLARLRFGSQGPAVKALQMALKQLGYYRGRVDGDMGPGTALAHVRWQQDQDGGAADGIVTPAAGRSLGFDMIRRQSVVTI